MKTCKECNEVKPLECFWKNKALKDGYENKCIDCRKGNKKQHKLTCKVCEKNFFSNKKNQIYCSNHCSSIEKKRRKLVCCPECNQEFYIVESRTDKVVYCSKECMKKTFSKKFSKESNPNFKSEKRKCDNCKKDIYVTPSEKRSLKHHYCSRECANSHKSVIYTGENNKQFKSAFVSCSYCGGVFERKPFLINDHNNFCSPSCKNQWLIQFNKSRVGENHPLWDFSKSWEERYIGRGYYEYLTWRKKILRRDKSCIKCGSKEDLVAHHILNYSEYPSLRTDINNGKTLCKDCHVRFHKIYGLKNNNHNQLNEFIKGAN